MKNSPITWTDHTFNPWIGCAKISEGCAHCYAETLMAKRYKRVQWGPNGTRAHTKPLTWRDPLKWNAEAAAQGIRYRVFTASLADIFEDREELSPWRDDLHELIRQTEHLDWLVLTKRPEIAARYYSEHPIPQNVWLGTSVENTAATRRIPILASIPAKVRFLSCEPLLEGIPGLDLHNIHWLIAGGESGVGARPVHPEWIRSLRDQCRDANVPFFFKQWGGTQPKTNGNTLDGRIHEEFPCIKNNKPKKQQ